MRSYISRFIGPRAAGMVLVGMGVVMLAALWMSSLTPAGAQLDPNSPPPVVDPVSCGHFETQADAQVYFETTQLSDPSVLDPDGDGFACEFRFGERTGGPPAFDPVSCGHFESQEAAQSFFDEGTLDDPGVLDGDGDGIACEFAFDAGTGDGDSGVTQEPAGQPAAVTSLPSTGDGAAAGNRNGTFSAVIGLLIVSGMSFALRDRLVR